VKKTVTAILICVMLFAALPFGVLAADGAEEPVLVDISFNNAEINSTFDPETHDYLLILKEVGTTPTLASYKIEGEANLFVNYKYDEMKHQTGIVVTLEFSSGSALYNFNYKNAEFYDKNSNNYLESVNCNIGFVYPEISNDVTEYTIYIPSDLTTLSISAVTQKVSAYCDAPPKEIKLKSEQVLDIPLIVTASNGEKRTYSFAVKRTNQKTDEFLKAVQSGKTEQFVKKEHFYNNPEFIIAVCVTVIAIAVLYLLFRISRRFTIKVTDGDEKDFFEM